MSSMKEALTKAGVAKTKKPRSTKAPESAAQHTKRMDREIAALISSIRK